MTPNYSLLRFWATTMHQNQLKCARLGMSLWLDHAPGFIQALGKAWLAASCRLRLTKQCGYRSLHLNLPCCCFHHRKPPQAGKLVGYGNFLEEDESQRAVKACPGIWKTGCLHRSLNWWAQWKRWGDRGGAMHAEMWRVSFGPGVQIDLDHVQVYLVV